VRRLEGVRDVDEPANLARERDVLVADEAAERRADDVLHREIEAAIGRTDIEDGDDVRMAE
jgi:hypothetical protein